MSLQKILLSFKPKPENLLEVLKAIQKENKYIGEKECEKIAEYFSLPLARIYSFASFFDEIRTRRKQKDNQGLFRRTLPSEDSAEVVRQIEMLLDLEAGNDAHPKYKLEL